MLNGAFIRWWIRTNAKLGKIPLFDRWIEALQLDAGIGGCELPVNGDLNGIAFCFLGFVSRPLCLFSGEAFVQTGGPRVSICQQENPGACEGARGCLTREDYLF